MPTSVHIPAALLEALKLKAQVLRVSRNHLIVKALERELTQPHGWSPGFFERLSAVDSGTRQAVDDLLQSVISARHSKEPQRL